MKKDLKQDLSRYRWGLINEKITDANQHFDKIMEIVTINTGDNTEFKKTLNKEELLAAVKIMKDAADISEVSNETYEIDIAKEIRGVLKKAKESVKLEEKSVSEENSVSEESSVKSN